jgi:hypothetical protein
LRGAGGGGGAAHIEAALLEVLLPHVAVFAIDEHLCS